MTNMVEPHRAADVGNDACSDVNSDDVQDGELTTLIRRWMAAGGKKQDRVRCDRVLRVAPEPSGPDDLVEGGSPRETDPPLGVPTLPRRTIGAEPGQVHRVALLIDARRVSADVATALLARLGERGAVNVCRAYADWNRSDLGDWVQQLRREGLHSFHHFDDDDDQALVAMAIDAVDIARDAAVDEVVIAGDLTSALPLVHRLHATGVRVVVAGSGHTPHDVRAACHEFIDTGSIDDTVMVSHGRHRA